MNSLDLFTHILKWGFLFGCILALITTGYNMYVVSVSFAWLFSEAVVLWLSIYVARRFVFLSSKTAEGATSLVMVRRPKASFMGDEPGL